MHEIQLRLEWHALCCNDKKKKNNDDEQENITQAFVEVFLHVNQALKQEPLIEPSYAGMTACVAFLRRNKLFITNVGDSHAVLGRKQLQQEPSNN